MNIKTMLAASTLAFLTACSGSNSNSSNGSITLNLTDAPIDEASHVYVSLSGVSLNFEDSGWVSYDFEEVQKIDLLTLQSGNTLNLLDGIEVEPGDYKVRLNIFSDDDNVPDNSIVLTEGGAEYDMTIPSGAQTGLKLTSSIVVPANGDVNYTIDFDVRKSVVRRGLGNDFALRPTLRLVDNTEAGTIYGEITDTNLLVTDCSDADPLTHNAIYVYEGADITPDDIGSAGTEPVTTTPVVYDEESGVYSYTAAFVLAGDYTIALTCNSDAEDIEADDELSFKAISNVTVVANIDSEDDDSIDD